MKKLPSLIFSILLSQILLAQNCSHTDLSRVFKFDIKIERISRINTLDSCIITITITKKKPDKFKQTIRYSSTFLYDSVFKRCSFVRSYTTGKNKNLEVGDNDHGDLVVADFNFDGKEDFAVVKESGWSDGPSYIFYIQSTSGSFARDKYLSDEVVYFPSAIDPMNKTLTTYALAGAIGVTRRIYKLDKANKWTLVSKKLLTD